MKRSILIVCFGIVASGCYSTRILTPEFSPRQIPAHNYDRQVTRVSRPTLSIAVIREPFTDDVNPQISQKLAKKLAAIFQESKVFSRISTGKDSVNSDYCLNFIVSERLKDQHGGQYFVPYFLSFATIPGVKYRYNISYIMSLNHEGNTWCSAALYERITWYGWTSLILAPIIDPFCTRPTSESILKALIRDIQEQGGFEELDLQIK